MPRTEPNQPWRIFVDTGGTFTDCLAIDPDGTTHRGKVLSSGSMPVVVSDAFEKTLTLEASWLHRPEVAKGAFLAADDQTWPILEIEPIDQRRVRATLANAPNPGIVGRNLSVTTGEEAPTLVTRLVTRTPAQLPLPNVDLRLATTRGTNALLERRGGRVAFFVTEGFADLLRIGDQTRPDLFALRVAKPEPLHERVVEVAERLDASGDTIRALDLDRLRRDARQMLDAGVRTAAVALAHAWRNPAHERAIGDVLRETGFEHVSLSSELSSALGLLDRAQTTVVNAYLSPVIDRYLDDVASPMTPSSTMLVMTSAGGLIDRPGFAPKDSLLSGPAGGVVGAAAIGRRHDAGPVIAFDMGGTSTDVTRCDEAPALTYRTRVGDANILAPSIAVETVAAGGGSVCSVRYAELTVGPESAGAHPGPACYGRGGPLTITDCNLLLNRIDPDRFAIPLDPGAAALAAEHALAIARDQVDADLTRDALLQGFLMIADQRMAEAIRRITLRQGHDPADHTLVAFGGAGPQHACALAEMLGIRRVLIPADAGLLSAYGLRVASLARSVEVTLLEPLAKALPELPSVLGQLEDEARDLLTRATSLPVAKTRTTLELRFQGLTDAIEVDASPIETIGARFRTDFVKRFGFAPDLDIDIVTARATMHTETQVAIPTPVPDSTPERHRGPTLLSDSHATTYLPEGWTGVRTPSGDTEVRRTEESGSQAHANPDAVSLELGVGKLSAIAQEMGERLRRAAISTNVKERRDFSCAILDREGRLLVNAPHVPVHLGSMGVCVRAIRALLGPDLARQTVITNHPAFGGSHLPDVTVVHPVHDERGTLCGYAAARAHHAEIGGIAPGSMAPDATRLAQEGVVIAPTLLGRPESIDWDALRALFLEGPHPSRDPDTNVRDVAAALHAVWAGAEGIRALADNHDGPSLSRIADIIRARAALRARECIARLPDGVFTHAEPVRDGDPLRVSITIDRDHARFDFAGSGQVHPRCLNATPAIVTSAVLYVIRLLIDEELPLNEGLLDTVEILVPSGTLNPTFSERDGPAVAGGNVEISQLLVESMLTALGLTAQSQGTMNNVVFGDHSFGFYETLAGGCGAGDQWAGASALHSHMTNTALTDLEVLEHRHPVRLEECSIRADSGGEGTHKGGDGMRRVYRFLRPVSVSFLQGRVTQPRGLQLGGAGALGVARVSDGEQDTPLSTHTSRIPANWCLVVESPGGGGWA